MEKLELQDLIKKQRKAAQAGKDRYNPALRSIFLSSQAEVDVDIAAIIETFKNKKGREPEEDELVAAYILYQEKKEKIKDQEMQSYIKAKEENLQTEVDKQEQIEQEQEEEQDLFLLDRLGATPRLQVREVEERNLQDRQKALMERSLRILAALEKIRDAMKQEKGMLQIDGDLFKGMNSREVKQQLGLLKAMGVQEVSRDQDGNILENEGREISIETLTAKDIEALESGEMEFAISLESLRSIDWRVQSEKMKEWFKDKDITLDGQEPVTIKGLEEPEIERQGSDTPIIPEGDER